jgi:predicted phosphodiesterase
VKILTISDIHAFSKPEEVIHFNKYNTPIYYRVKPKSLFDLWKRFLNEKIDVIVLAGDIGEVDINHLPLCSIQKFFRIDKNRILRVAGNHDIHLPKMKCSINLTPNKKPYFDYKIIDGCLFIGFHSLRFLKTNSKFGSLEKIKQYNQKVLDTIENIDAKKKILIVHEPPLSPRLFPYDLYERTVPFASWDFHTFISDDVLEAVDIIISGHIHEAEGYWIKKKLFITGPTGWLLRI